MHEFRFERQMTCARGLSQSYAAAPEDPGRVALFLPTLSGGGAERAFVNLARGMSELGAQVDLVVGNADGDYRSEVPDSVNLVDLRAARLLRALPGLVRHLRRQQPARLYSALEEANILALLAARLSRLPIRVYPSLRNTLSDELATVGGPKLKIMTRLARLLYPQANGFVAVSSGVADDASSLLGIPRDRISVIANPTITPELAALAAAPLDDPWFAPDALPVVLGCGRLAKQKDFATLLEAFALIRARTPARLVILGEGPLRGDLKAQAARLGLAADVSMPGFEPNPFRFMSRCAVFVLSSLHEGSPNVLVQALACGAPVVATDCPSGPREILNGVATGRLVPTRDPVAMAEAMKGFLNADLVRPQQLRLDRFSYRTSAAAYLALDG
jgi:glycosyltransferase involved in cell wall biosynthesis